MLVLKDNKYNGNVPSFIYGTNSGSIDVLNDDDLDFLGFVLVVEHIWHNFSKLFIVHDSGSPRTIKLSILKT